MTNEKPTSSPKAAPAPAQLSLPWRGLGIFNVYFILKFALAYFGYVNLDVLLNALLIAGLLIPLRPAWLSRVRDAAGVVAALALLYSESWLPGIESVLANTGNIAGFSWRYTLELALDFVNLTMVGWAALVLLLWYLLRNCVRITFLTLCYFVAVVTMPYLDAFRTDAREPEKAGGAAPVAATAQTASTDQKAIDAWYQAFLEYEKDRRAELPAGLAEKDTPFDILLLNICSLSNDDLAASGLDTHPVLGSFNIRFDRFNAATSYSGPAAIRLLNGACGQPSHNAMYGERRPECEVLTRLGTLGYSQYVMMDHSGEYDSFLQGLRDKTGLTAPWTTRPFPVRYMGFDDEPISDDLAVLRHWQRTMTRSKTKRNVTYMNFIALHDGNRLPRHGRSEPFKPRAKQLLDDLQVFIRELERSGRKVMLVVVPEHGAAVRGDRIQAPRLRDIPSLRITEVPLMVKFVGLRGLPEEPIHVTGTTSYLAMTTLIGKTLSTNYFGKRGGSVPLEELVKDLPQTNRVSENGQAQVLEFQGKEYLRQNGGQWKPYIH